jgi:hypothetical protein
MASFIWPPSVGSGGTITSVGLADGSSTPIYNISGSPVTTSGTLTFSLKTENANLVFAGPTTGAAAQPTFRALVAADITALTGNLSDVGTDGITIGNGTGAVFGSGTTISQHVADTTHNGYLSSTDWNTFNNKQPTITEGNLTEATSSVLTISGGTNCVIGSGTSIQVKQASTSISGYLSSTDWNTFNGKQASGSYITALTGDGTASGPGSVALTLATVNTNTGSWGSSTAIPNFTVNGKGLITAAGTNVVIAPAGTLSGTTLNSTVVTSSLTSVGTITSGTWTGTTIAIANGGTGQTTNTAAFDALAPTPAQGDILYYNGSHWVVLAPGTSGQTLKTQGASANPVWATPAAFDFFASSQVTTSGTAITSGTFATFSNSPSFSVTANYTGTYKVYSNAGTSISAASGAIRVIATSGSPTLLDESQGFTGCVTSVNATTFIQSVYTLTSGNTYVFDIQGLQSSGSGGITLNGSVGAFYMFCERVG